MKEKLDKQLTGQSSTPFMRASRNDNYSGPTSNKRGVTFDTMETLERNSNCIDKLTSLVGALKMTIDMNSLLINQRFTKVDLETKTETDKILHREIDPLVEAEVKVEIGEIITIETTRDQITEIDQEADVTIIRQVIGAIITRITINEVIIDQIMDKTLNKHLQTEVKVEIEHKITILTI